MGNKVLLLSNAYWPSIGGIENSLRHLAQEAMSAGDEVSIIVSDIGVATGEAERFATVVDGVAVHRYPIAPFSGLLKPLNIFLANWKLFRLLRKEYLRAPETRVIARFHFSALAAVWAGFRNVRYLVPSIVANQSGREQGKSDSLQTRLRRRLFVCLHNMVQRAALRRCTNFVFSETMRSQCAELAGNRSESYRLTKPGVDLRRFSVAGAEERYGLKQKLNLPVDKKLILFVGRFVKAKGVDLLIDSMQHLADSYHVVLVGGGDEKQDYIDRLKSQRLESRVTVVEPTRVVEDYYRCADLFVMSSRYEPLGQTLLEAFSSGLPVTAFKRTDDVDTATQELGMDSCVSYAESVNSKALAQAIESCLQKYGVDSERGRISSLAHSKFSWTKLYQELVAQCR